MNFAYELNGKITINIKCETFFDRFILDAVVVFIRFENSVCYRVNIAGNYFQNNVIFGSPLMIVIQLHLTTVKKIFID